MADRLEFKVNIGNVAPKLPKVKAKTAYNSYIDGISEDIIPNLMKVKNATKLEKVISKVNKENKAIIKAKMKDLIGGSTDFSNIAKDESYGMSVNARVEASTSRVLKQNRIKIKRLYSDISKANNVAKSGVLTANEAQKEIDNIINNYINNISKSLGGESSRLIKNETKAFRERQFVEKHKGEEVEFILGKNEDHCAECLSYEGNIYPSPHLAPVLPVHNSCECYYKLTKSDN